MLPLVVEEHLLLTFGQGRLFHLHQPLHKITHPQLSLALKAGRAILCLKTNALLILFSCEDTFPATFPEQEALPTGLQLLRDSDNCFPTSHSLDTHI